MTADGGDTLWYKDAIVYELHVKTFADGNDDGIGDFEGLTARLDYLGQLGVTCLWLLPFYESPLRDDGYDIAHYERVDPRYGSLDDFRQFLHAAHARGMRVITELVINHTSDAHPWFQASRRAAPGSMKRDFYVWSDTERRYEDARVIFSDTESSNWSWDAAAGAFYWHRFFSHQPDLNFENPHVREAILKVMRFWLDIGVDGLRLDAVAHLFEREGTACENLPETHAFLKDIRADMDRRYHDRVFLAEVNHAPEVVREYFGDGDECHMAFHFPLMPRLFAAFAAADGTGVAEMVTRTMDIPAGCQWATFLRNHDELTLSSLDAAERERMIDIYAPEPRMRLNGGIRRRLAALLGHDPRRIAAAYALLLALPGTPVLYYGDEIGIGDDVDLADRDGLRTPMQWSADAHGGFCAASASPCMPAIADGRHGSSAVNVSAQLLDPQSVLRRIRPMIHARRRHRAFSRGAVEFLSTGNPRVLAFARRWEDATVTVVVSLSGSAESVMVDIPDPGGPLFDVINAVPFPGAGSSTCAIELDAYGYHWLELAVAGRASKAVGAAMA